MLLQIVHDVPQSTLAKERPEDVTSDQSHGAPTGPPPAILYQTVVVTGSKMGSGTDALITMEVRTFCAYSVGPDIYPIFPSSSLWCLGQGSALIS